MASTKLEAFLARVGAKPICEVCGQNSWSLPDDDAPMTVRLLTETPAAMEPQPGMFGFSQPNSLRMTAPKAQQKQTGTVTAFVVACTNCGQIRLHAETVVRQGMGG